MGVVAIRDPAPKVATFDNLKQATTEMYTLKSTGYGQKLGSAADHEAMETGEEGAGAWAVEGPVAVESSKAVESLEERSLRLSVDNMQLQLQETRKRLAAAAAKRLAAQQEVGRQQTQNGQQEEEDSDTL